MTKKRVVLAILAALVLLLPTAGYYAYYGLIRKEHFYRGLPASYWEAGIRRWEHRDLFAAPSHLDTLLTYLGFRGEPAILNGDKAANPVLLDLLFASDKDVRSRATCALAGDFNEPGKVFIGPILMTGRAVPVEADNKNYLALLIHHDDAFIPGLNVEWLLLTDRDGNRLDTVSCFNSTRWTGLCTQECADEADGTSFVVRYADAPDEWRKRYGTHTVIHGQKRYDNLFAAKPPPRIPDDDWERKGLCRIAVRDGKFEVLWPPLSSASKEASR
jgi:hypothetical protein